MTDVIDLENLTPEQIAEREQNAQWADASQLTLDAFAKAASGTRYPTLKTKYFRTQGSTATFVLAKDLEDSDVRQQTEFVGGRATNIPAFDKYGRPKMQIGLLVDIESHNLSGEGKDVPPEPGTTARIYVSGVGFTKALLEGIAGAGLDGLRGLKAGTRITLTMDRFDILEGQNRPAKVWKWEVDPSTTTNAVGSAPASVAAEPQSGTAPASVATASVAPAPVAAPSAAPAVDVNSLTPEQLQMLAALNKN